MSTSTPLASQFRSPPTSSVTTVDVVVPVYNEARTLERSARTLRRYLDERFPFPARVTIVDNASTDGTWEVASRVAAQVRGVQAMRIERKGRGRALRAAWSASDAAIVAYMDVDLSTDLDALLPLVAPLLSGHSDISIGSRLARGSRVVRGPRRELLSRSYNVLVRAALDNRFTDAQCGFKALRADVARALLPHVKDDSWFFDTELLVLAARNDLRIHEVPVDWVDDPESRVDLVATVIGDLRGIGRLWRTTLGGRDHTAPVRRPLPPRTSESSPHAPAPLARLSVGAVIVYLAMFAGLQPVLGPLPANAVAITVATVAAVARAQRRARPGGKHPVISGLRSSIGTWLWGLALSSVSLLLVGLLSGSIPAALAALVAANLVGDLAVFLAVRQAAYRTHLDESPEGHSPTHW